MPELPKIWPTDRISDDHTVSDAIHNAVLAERERADYADHRLMKAWRIAVGDDPEAEFDTNNFYDLIREGAEAKKKLAEGDQAVKEFLAGRIDEALVEFDVTLAAVNIAVKAERERCANIAEHAFDHMSPLAIYESYNADGKKVTRLNTESSSRAIAAKIRSGE